MKPIQEATRQKLRKILALAHGGVQGERANAVRMLQELLRTHGVTIEDIQGESKVRVVLKCRNAVEGKVANQFVARMTNTGTVRYGIMKGARAYSVNESHAIKLSALWPDILKSWRKHHSRLTKKHRAETQSLSDAFIHANHLYAPDDGDGESPELSPEEAARIVSMAREIDAVSLTDRIECSTTAAA